MKEKKEKGLSLLEISVAMLIALVFTSHIGQISQQMKTFYTSISLSRKVLDAKKLFLKEGDCNKLSSANYYCTSLNNNNNKNIYLVGVKVDAISPEVFTLACSFIEHGCVKAEKGKITRPSKIYSDKNTSKNDSVIGVLTKKW